MPSATAFTTVWARPLDADRGVRGTGRRFVSGFGSGVFCRAMISPCNLSRCRALPLHGVTLVNDQSPILEQRAAVQEDQCVLGDAAQAATSQAPRVRGRIEHLVAA